MSKTTFLQERLAAKKAQLAELDAAVTAVNTGVQEYELDTGHSRQMVTRSNIDTFHKQMRTLEDEICRLEDRLNGSGGVLYGRPGW